MPYLAAWSHASWMASTARARAFYSVSSLSTLPAKMRMVLAPSRDERSVRLVLESSAKAASLDTSKKR